MPKFKDHTISAKHLLEYIPEALISNLSLTTKIDHYAKVLHGNKLFYLLLYGILDNEKLSQRTLEDTFNDSLNKNGIQVMLYMTLITAMLVLIYKKAN